LSGKQARSGGAGFAGNDTRPLIAHDAAAAA